MDEYRERLNISLAVLFATVAVRFTMNQYLPPTETMTNLDFYVLAVYAFIIFSAVKDQIIIAVLATRIDEKCTVAASQMQQQKEKMTAVSAIYFWR